MQAARGTSLSEDSGLTDTPSAPSRGRAWTVLLAVFALLYAVDQVTKWLAVDRLSVTTRHQLVDVMVLQLGAFAAQAIQLAVVTAH